MRYYKKYITLTLSIIILILIRQVYIANNKIKNLQNSNIRILTVSNTKVPTYKVIITNKCGITEYSCTDFNQPCKPIRYDLNKQFKKVSDEN